MQVSLVGCVFVLQSEINIDNKKNDIKSLKVIVNKNTKDLIRCEINKENFKDNIRNKIKSVINSDDFHLEQVYTMGEKKYFEDNNIDILYMGLTNISNINLDSDYELLDFSIIDEEKIVFGSSIFNYETIQTLKANSLEYSHKIDIDNIVLEKELLELLIIYKHLRNRIDNTDVCFKLLSNEFTLEDVRIVYELIKNVKVDKSNFRKKIIKYCTKVDDVAVGKGYRPSQMYKFNPDSIKKWI